MNATYPPLPTLAQVAYQLHLGKPLLPAQHPSLPLPSSLAQVAQSNTSLAERRMEMVPEGLVRWDP